MMSPETAESAFTTSGVGSLSSSSSWATFSDIEYLVIDLANCFPKCADSLSKFFAIPEPTANCDPIKRSRFHRQNSFTFETPATQNALDAAQLTKAVDQFGGI